MNARRMRRIAAFVLFAVVALAVLGGLVMLLWNWLAPPIFGARPIDFWQALGLFALARLLVGGLRRGGHHGHWRGRMAERWAAMSDEERERVRASMQRRCGGRARGEEPPTATAGT